MSFDDLIAVVNSSPISQSLPESVTVRGFGRQEANGAKEKERASQDNHVEWFFVEDNQRLSGI